MSSNVAYLPVLDEEERNRRLMEELPQVRYIARHIHERLPKHIPLEDLVHAGVIGLIDALQKFDASKNVQFKTYAKFRIRGAILDSLRELDWSPRELRRKSRQLEDVTQKLSSQLGRAATEQEIADELDLTLDEFQRMLTDLDGLDIGSLQTDSSGDGPSEDLCEFLPGDPEQTPYCICLRSEMKEMLAEAIRQLSPKEQQVLSLYYFEELTMKEVGAVLGIGESRVSQIHSLAVVRLRAAMQNLTRDAQIPAALLNSSKEMAWKKY